MSLTPLRAGRWKNDKIGKQIQRLWGNLPVVDARDDLRLFVLPEDIVNAVKGDAKCCLFAQACKRAVGATHVLFLRRVAYLDLPTSNGKRQVERFNLTPEMRQVIEKFDRGHPVVPSGGFLLTKPERSLEKKRKESARYRARDRRLGIVRSYKKRSDYQTDKPIIVDVVRNGMGTVHFTKRAKTKK